MFKVFYLLLGNVCRIKNVVNFAKINMSGSPDVIKPNTTNKLTTVKNQHKKHLLFFTSK